MLDTVQVRKEIGTKIKEARKAKDLNQSQLAEAIGVNQDKISILENGLSNYTIDTLIKVDHFLKLGLF